MGAVSEGCILWLHVRVGHRTMPPRMEELSEGGVQQVQMHSWATREGQLTRRIP